MHLLACFWQDLRFGVRNLAKGRTFTAIALGSLALGIGGSTAMYSVIYAVILHPFIYKDADHLMSVTVRSPEDGATAATTRSTSLWNWRNGTRSSRA